MLFSGALSSVPSARFRSGHRVDPYWGGVWQLGAQAQWVSREHLTRLAESGLVSSRHRFLRTNPADALLRVHEDWEAKLNILGVLAQWRTATAEQVFAFCGDGIAQASYSRALQDLFAMGAIDRGSVLGAEVTGSEHRGVLLRPSVSSVFDRVLRPRMSYAEWVSVTGGKKFLTGGQFDRHNVLAAELGLRVAEFVPMGTVLGEGFARVNELAYTSAGLPEPPGRSGQTSADAVLVRRDGARVAVELTASASGRSFRAKVEAWARVLAKRPAADSGLCVVFVVAERPNAGEAGVHSIAATVRAHVAAACRTIPGVASNRTAERIFVVSWRDWFPARHELSEQFLGLQAQRPSGTDGAWTDAALSDPETVAAPSGLPDATAVIGNSAGLRCVPHQLRAHPRPDLSAVVLSAVGFDGVPQIRVDPRSGARRGAAKRARGAVPEAVLPERLRY